jgi:hypothetical protein
MCCLLSLPMPECYLSYVCLWMFMFYMFVDVHAVYVCGSVITERERRGDTSQWQSREWNGFRWPT